MLELLFMDGSNCMKWIAIVYLQFFRIAILLTGQVAAPITDTQTTPNQADNSAPQPPITGPADPALDPNNDRQGMAATELPPELTLADVIASIYRSFPVVEQARLQQSVARGDLVSSFGAFDTRLYGGSLSEPSGVYRNYRLEIGLARRTWWGGYVGAGYRLGRGDFAPWYKERETDKSGEYKLAATFPLLQGRAIDAYRVAIFQASVDQRLAEPLLQQAILDTALEATRVYWQWVAAAASVTAQESLLSLAKTRGEQLDTGFKAGRFKEVDVIFNRQLIAEREGKVLETQQKLVSASSKLAIFLRDDNGQIIFPVQSWAPLRYPIVQPPPAGDFQADLSQALSRRPEPKSLSLEIQRLQYEQRLARNQLLPHFDVIGEASQDAGDAASSANDKSRFELLVGVQGEVPIQRRKARGKLQSVSAKTMQLNEKLRLQQDKIASELQIAFGSLNLAAGRVKQAETALRTAVDALERYRFAFTQGYVDLIYLNLLETKANESEIKLIEAQENWFDWLAAMQAALGLDPLDQSLTVGRLPRSQMPTPGSFQNLQTPSEDALRQDWQRNGRAAPQ